jgi:hypothetical protein
MINNIIYGIVVLVILFSLYHFVKDMVIFFNDWWYTENSLTKAYSNFMKLQHRYF